MHALIYQNLAEQYPVNYCVNSPYNFHFFPLISMKWFQILMFSKGTKSTSFSLQTPSLGLYYVIILAYKK